MVFIKMDQLVPHVIQNAHNVQPVPQTALHAQQETIYQTILVFLAVI